MADDNLIQAAIGALEGFNSAFVPFQKARFEDQLLQRREQLKSQNELDLYKQKLPLEEASKIRIEKAKPPINIYNTSTGETIQAPRGSKTFSPPAPKETTEDKAKSKNDAKLQAEKPKALGSLRDTMREYDNMIKEAEDIRNDPGLGKSTGIMKYAQIIPGTQAKKIGARLETLKAKTLLNVLASLKQLSSTGASGFGQLSNIEGEQIKNSISTLDASQGTKDFQDSLDRFITEMKNRKESLKQTFDQTYGAADYSPVPVPRPKPDPEQGGDKSSNGGSGGMTEAQKRTLDRLQGK